MTYVNTTKNHKMKTSIKLFSLIFLFGIIFQVQAQKDDFVLLVVDVQDFENVKENLAQNIYRDFLLEVNKTIESFDPERVAYIKDMSLVASLSFKGIDVDTASFIDFDKDLVVVNTNIFIKSEGDSFTAEGLDSFLEKCPDHKILVVGLIADGCIYSTLKSGCKQDYEMYIVPNAILARSEISKRKYLKKYEKMGVKVWEE